jgi:hypothetical protein
MTIFSTSGMDVRLDPGKRRMFLDQSEERSGVRSMFLQPDTNAARSPEGQPSCKKVLFASVHSILDFSNGASVATLDVLQGLTACGFECQAFCTAKLDLTTEVSFEKMIGGLNEPFQLRPSVCGAGRARVLYTRRHQVPITFIRQQSTRHFQQSRDEIQTVPRFFARFLDICRPDVLLTYGGDAIMQGMIAVARLRGITVVFGLDNFGYTQAQHFSQVDSCIVPSEFARRHYRDTLGLDCRTLPNPVDWERVRVEQENLSHCLGSVQGLFDEIVVVDTGSVDRTREIAHDFGARVFGFAWIDDFAAARNEALAHATGDYAFWLDADDVVEPAEREKLAGLLRKLRRGDEAAYGVRCACDSGRSGFSSAAWRGRYRPTRSCASSLP